LQELSKIEVAIVQMAKEHDARFRPSRPDRAYEVGEQVEGCYEGHLGFTEWFEGSISAVRGNGTYDIEYDDGDKEERVPTKFIRPKTRLSLLAKPADLTWQEDFSGEELVGRTIKILSPTNQSGKKDSDKTWKTGSIAAYHSDTGLHTVKFGSDKSAEDLDLSAETIVLLQE